MNSEEKRLEEIKKEIDNEGIGKTKKISLTNIFHKYKPDEKTKLKVKNFNKELKKKKKENEEDLVYPIKNKKM